MNNLNLVCGVKQFVAVVQGSPPWDQKFMVFATGDDKFYLFQPIRDGIAVGDGFPVEKKRLRDDIRRALAHGWGNAGI